MRVTTVRNRSGTLHAIDEIIEKYGQSLLAQAARCIVCNLADKIVLQGILAVDIAHCIDKPAITYMRLPPRFQSASWHAHTHVISFDDHRTKRFSGNGPEKSDHALRLSQLARRRLIDGVFDLCAGSQLCGQHD